MAVTCLASVPLFLGLGAGGASQAELEALRLANESLRIENESYRKRPASWPSRFRRSRPR